MPRESEVVFNEFINFNIVHDIDQCFFQNQFDLPEDLIKKIEEVISNRLPFRVSLQMRDKLLNAANDLHQANIELFREHAKICILSDTFKKPFYIGLRNISFS